MRTALAVAVVVALGCENALAQSGDGAAALLWAVHRNQIDQVDRLIGAGADVNARNELGVTPLSEAALAGNTGIIERLLKAGANADSPGADGQTALMVVAR